MNNFDSFFNLRRRADYAALIARFATVRAALDVNRHSSRFANVPNRPTAWTDDSASLVRARNHFLDDGNIAIGTFFPGIRNHFLHDGLRHFDAIARARDDALFDVSHDFYTTASLLLKGFDRLSSVTYDQTRSRLALHLDSLRSFLLEEFIEH